ncbi:MAG: hypothetical protein HY928_00325 [Elusimicrobia bacterium]|nr:hypothetical protein [Elusimicrobiota bacterium]
MNDRTWAAPAVVCYAFLAVTTWTFEGRAAQKLTPRGFGQLREFTPPEKSPQKARSSGGVPFARIKRVHAGYSLSYGFKNFNSDVLTVETELNSEAVAEAIKEFGFREDDFKALDAWYKNAQEKAAAEADEKYVKGEVKADNRAQLEAKIRFINDINKKVQADLEKALAGLSAEYRRRRMEIYTKAGFRFAKEGVVKADIPGLAKRNWRRVRPLAQAFAEVSEEKGYDAEDLVGAVTAMVQTSLRYEVPDTKEGSRVIGGAMPPPQTLILGQGDCDTKTAVIASILLSWPNIKMVGLGIPGHYLMAYHRIPRSGDVYLEYKGLPYVMIESAGPAWIAPGTVGDQTQAYLDSGQDFRIQPISL